MAYATHPQSSTFSNIWTGIKGVFAAVGRGLMVSSSADARLAQVERLNAKSDAELAEMGLKRQDIAAYVFRDLMHI